MMAFSWILRRVHAISHPRTREGAFLIGCLGALLLAGCVTAPSAPREAPGQARLLDMGEYTVAAPPGDGWIAEKNGEAGTVRFTRQKVWSSGRVLGVTVISVIRNRVMGNTPISDEETEANRFRDHEENGMIEFGVKTGQYGLSDVRRDTTALDGRKYYLLRYRQKIARGFSRPDLIVEAVLYIHYPADFPQKRVFYVFHIADSKENFSLATIDTAQIEPVVRSFRLK